MRGKGKRHGAGPFGSSQACASASTGARVKKGALLPYRPEVGDERQTQSLVFDSAREEVLEGRPERTGCGSAVVDTTASRIEGNVIGEVSVRGNQQEQERN